MVVFDVVVNGEIKETLKPENQRLREMYWFMVDQMQVLTVKYGSTFKVHKRIIL
jgi:hypothetical protein